VGQPCIGRLREGVAGVVALVIDIGNPGEPLLLPSLALATVGQYMGLPQVMRGDDGRVFLSDGKGRASRRIDFADWEGIDSSNEKTCSAMTNKPVEAARRILDPLPVVLSRGRPEVIPYESVLEGAPADVEGTIVLVGVGLRDDAHWRVLRRLGLAEQHGYALHADAIDTLLRGRFLRGIGAPLQLAWLVLFASAGMAVGRFIPTHRERARQLALAGLVVGDAVIVALVAVNLGVLMDALYSMLAVFAGYVFVKR
jgi:hypothetical protein